MGVVAVLSVAPVGAGALGQVAVLVVGACAGCVVWLLWPRSSGRLSQLSQARRVRRGSVLVRIWKWAFGQLTLGESQVEQLAFDLDLVAICLRAGLPIPRAFELAARATQDRSGLGRLGRSLALGSVDNAYVGTQDSVAEHRTVVSLVEFSRSTGVALAPLLSGLASDMRRAERRRRQMAAAKLGVHLVIPLGVCVLPSVILTGVVPVVITLVGDMSAIFVR